MHHLSRFAEWLKLLLNPGTGAHRRRAHPCPGAVPGPAPHPVHAARPPHLPRLRSPYGVPAVLDGTAIALVRPYVLAHERERVRQRQRQLALVLAADFGVDLDTRMVGQVSAQGVAA